MHAQASEVGAAGGRGERQGERGRLVHMHKHVHMHMQARAHCVHNAALARSRLRWGESNMGSM